MQPKPRWVFSSRTSLSWTAFVGAAIPLLASRRVVADSSLSRSLAVDTSEYAVTRSITWALQSPTGRHARGNKPFPLFVLIHSPRSHTRFLQRFQVFDGWIDVNLRREI